MKRDSFVFYRSFFEALETLDDAARLASYDAIVKYALDGVAEASGVAATVLTLAKPVIDSNNQRYLNGCAGGRPKKSEAGDNQRIAKTKPKLTGGEPYVYVNENVNVNDIKDITRTRARAKKTKPPDKWKPKDERVYDYDELENQLRGCYG